MKKEDDHNVDLNELDYDELILFFNSNQIDYVNALIPSEEQRKGRSWFRITHYPPNKYWNWIIIFADPNDVIEKYNKWKELKFYG